MNRLMIDGTHDNVPAMASIASRFQLIAGYDTGTQDVMWTAEDWNNPAFANKEHVHIDQGFTGSPVPTSTVRDCEKGAWSISEAVKKENWVAERPTLYVGYPNTITQVLNAGWRGDLWLVIAESQPQIPPIVPGCNVVAVQFAFQTRDDISVVFDSYWPHRAPKFFIPRKEDNMVIITRRNGTQDVFGVTPSGIGYHTAISPEGVPLFNDQLQGVWAYFIRASWNPDETVLTVYGEGITGGAYSVIWSKGVWSPTHKVA